MQWYIIHTYSGLRRKSKESLESRVAAFSLQDKIEPCADPMEEVLEVRGGKKVVRIGCRIRGTCCGDGPGRRNLAHRALTPRVTGFVGSATSPSPLTERK